MDIKKELNEALTMLGAIMVSGDAVDFMAAAKSKIRQVVKSLDEKPPAPPKIPPDKEVIRWPIKR